MSYTVVDDGQQTSRDLENVVNRILRHCKIGKVTRKAKASQPNPGWPQGWRWEPTVHDPFRDILTYGVRQCSCKPGQACNNAACPHMPVVTCGTAQPPVIPPHGILM